MSLSRLAARLLEVVRSANVTKPIPPAGTPALKPLSDGIKAANAAINDLPRVTHPDLGAGTDITGLTHSERSAVLPPVTHPNPFNSEAFYSRLREGPLHHRSTEQVAATNAILAAMKGDPISWVAYALGTAWHETGGNMKPNVESLNYSVSGLLKTFGRHRISRADAERLGRKPGASALSLAQQRAIGNIIYGGEWGRENLGNTEPDDGWTYRGRGMDHCTGRRNYGRTGAAIGVDLLADPDALLDLGNAVRALTTGMKSGRYVPGHTLDRHLPRSREASAAEFGQARRIINGQDAAGKIAAEALLFQRALQAGGWV